MTDNKLTDEEIVKRLERCVKRGNRNYNTDIVLDLINRQKAEIEMLKSANDEKFRQWNMLAEKTKQHYAYLYNEAKDRLKAEAYKEFANQIKMHKRRMRGFDLCNEFWDYAVLVEDIDNILKTMVGEEE